MEVRLDLRKPFFPISESLIVLISTTLMHVVTENVVSVECRTPQVATSNRRYGDIPANEHVARHSLSMRTAQEMYKLNCTLPLLPAAQFHHEKGTGGDHFPTKLGK